MPAAYFRHRHPFFNFLQNPDDLMLGKSASFHFRSSPSLFYSDSSCFLGIRINEQLKMLKKMGFSVRQQATRFWESSYHFMIIITFKINSQFITTFFFGVCQLIPLFLMPSLLHKDTSSEETVSTQKVPWK